jgi:hypothetical protein
MGDGRLELCSICVADQVAGLCRGAICNSGQRMDARDGVKKGGPT